MSDTRSPDDLTKIWYQKLKDDGFEDIESSPDHLKRWSSDFATEESVRAYEAKTAYYRMARHFLADHKFSNNKERIIWEYHSEGISDREISRTLKGVKITINRMTVWRTVKRLQAIMKQLYMDNNE